MNPEQWLPFLIVLAFPFFWSAILLLLANIGGWARLAKVFPSDRAEWSCYQTFHFRSGRLGATNYGSCLTLRTSERGLYLAVLFPFRVGHPPLFIPWEEFRNVAENNSLFGGKWLEADIGEPCIAHVKLPGWIGEHLPTKMHSQ